MSPPPCSPIGYVVRTCGATAKFRGPRPYDVALVFRPSTDPEATKGRRMTSYATAAVLTTLAEGEGGGNHESLSPYLTGGGALFALLLLLFITTRFNRDR